MSEPFIPEGIRKQREWLDAQHAQVMPCWACGFGSNQPEASQGDYDPYGNGNTFACPSCSVPMIAGCFLVAVGPTYWHWSRPADLIVTATEWRTPQPARDGVK